MSGRSARSVEDASMDFIEIDDGGASSTVGRQSLLYDFWHERGSGQIVNGPKNRFFKGVFKDGKFQLFPGLETETKAFDYDPSHAGVVTPRKALPAEQKDAKEKMDLLRRGALRKMQMLEEMLQQESALLIAKKDFWDFLLRVDRCIEIFVTQKKIYIKEMRGAKSWTFPFDHCEEYNDALASALEYLERESEHSDPEPRR